MLLFTLSSENLKSASLTEILVCGQVALVWISDGHNQVPRLLRIIEISRILVTRVMSSRDSTSQSTLFKTLFLESRYWIGLNRSHTGDP